MNTRRSWKNQERLFKALFKSTAAASVRPVVQCCFNCLHYPQGGRNRATCRLSGETISGVTQDKACFQSQGNKDNKP